MSNIMQPTIAKVFSYRHNKACDVERAPPDATQIVDESSWKWVSLTSLYNYQLFTNKTTKKTRGKIFGLPLFYRLTYFKITF